MRSLSYTCPDCRRKLAPVGGALSATQVIRRKCRGCRSRWQIVIVPLERMVCGLPGAWFDAGTFTKLGSEDAQ